MRHLMIWACTGLFVSIASLGAEDFDAEVDALFEAFAQPGSPGAAVTVMKGDAIVLEKAYGLAQLEYDIPVTSETIFHVASVSKQFATFAVVLLAHEGALTLDDDIRDHLPGFPDLGHVITIRHLIHHTSGIRDQWSLLQTAGWRMDDVITRDDIMKLMRAQRDLNFPPGDAHLYSNAGYTLIGEIVANVSGQSLKEFTQERIFEPLGMTHTHFHDDHRHIVPNRAYSYGRLGEDAYQKLVLSYANVGATSLLTTGADLMKWQRNFVTGEVGGVAATETMLERGALNDGRTIRYGFGLSHGTYKGTPIISHGGADAGFRSYLMRFPEADLSVAVLSNLAQADTGGLALSVAELFMDTAPPTPSAPGEQAAPNDAADPESYEGLYLNTDINQLYRLNVRDGKLRLTQGVGGEPVVFDAQADGTFRSGGGGIVEMDVAADGSARAMHITFANAVRRTFTPTERPKRDEVELESYAGRYFSPELDAFMDVRVDGKRLIIERRKEGPSPATPAFRDGFSWEGETIRFERGDDGTVTGLRANSGRVLNLRFDRTR